MVRRRGGDLWFPWEWPQSKFALQDEKASNDSVNRTMDTADGVASAGEFADELLSLAWKNWLVEGAKKRPKFNPKLVDQIFNGLNERSFPLRELLILDQSLYLEKYVL